MTQAQENREYFHQRAQKARESAMHAVEPAVRKIHLEMADRYAARSRAPDPVTPVVAAFNEF